MTLPHLSRNLGYGSTWADDYGAPTMVIHEVSPGEYRTPERMSSQGTSAACWITTTVAGQRWHIAHESGQYGHRPRAGHRCLNAPAVPGVASKPK